MQGHSGTAGSLHKFMLKKYEDDEIDDTNSISFLRRKLTVLKGA